MKRRDFVRGAAFTATGLTLGSRLWADSRVADGKSARDRGIHYEVHGRPDGKPLFLAFPIMASHSAIFGESQATVLQSFLDRLTDRYRVLVVDYPSIGKSASIAPAEFTAHRVCADMLAVADAAGFERFAWWGGSFGAVAGLLLASRSERVSALVCAGWPPLGAPYADMLKATRANVADPPAHARVILRELSQYAQWVTFYGSMQSWPEAKAVAGIKCSKMVFFGSEAEGNTGGVKLPFAVTIREHRSELEKLGWRVMEIPGKGSGVIIDAPTAVPVVRSFLDTVS